MKRINKIVFAAAVSLIFASCVDEYKSDFLPEKPMDVAVNEFLGQYDVLKNYIDRSANPDFKLGLSVSASDFQKKETMFSLAMTNFDEIMTGSSITHSSIVKDDGTMDFSTVRNTVETATEAGLSVYGPALCWHANQNAYYLNELIAPVIIITEPESGKTVVFDFESEALGTTFRMTGNGSATVVVDPAGQSGNVLNIAGPASYSYPEFDITLPAGRKLGDYVRLVMDFNGKGSSGLYGGGMRMGIKGGGEATYNTPANFGCTDGNWGRGQIVMEFDKIGLSAAQKELTTFTLYAGSGTGSGDYYIDNIWMEWETTGTPAGIVTVANFDAEDTGATYPMTGNGHATVTANPAAGQPGKALNVGGPTSYSYPKFNVELPGAVTLGDCQKVSLRFYGNGSAGRYGSGMRLIIDDNEFIFATPANYGCADDTWGAITMDLSEITLSVAQKRLTEFTLAVGSGTGSGNYYIDDVEIHWEQSSIIEKTPEEKEEILSEALEAWIAGMMENSGGSVKAWDVINEPMSDDASLMLRSAETDPNPSANFYWNDYLGDNYARSAIHYARQHFTEHGGNGNDLKLFVNDYGLEKGGNKCQRLIEMIRQWEEDGTIIDGIGTQMKLVYSMDPAKQEQYENNIVNMLQTLAATGKLIRISGMTMSVEDASGGAIKINNLTFSHQTAISAYYNFIVRKYFEIIPAAQRYGITHDRPISVTTTTTEAETVGLWTSGYNRNYPYAGFADGLAGKE